MGAEILAIVEQNDGHVVFASNDDTYRVCRQSDGCWSWYDVQLGGPWCEQHFERAGNAIRSLRIWLSRWRVETYDVDTGEGRWAAPGGRASAYIVWP